MTDKDFDAAARALETRDRLEGSFDLDGVSYDLELQEPTLGELEEIEEDLAAGDDEVEAIRQIVDEFLIQPEIDPDDIGVGKLQKLFIGMKETWLEMGDFEEAREQMPVEGNGRRSRR